MFVSPYWSLPRKGSFCWGWKSELQNKTGVSCGCGAEMVVGKSGFSQYGGLEETVAVDPANPGP